MRVTKERIASRGLPPEHPRASSTDDVEGFFSLLHDQLGDVFDHKVFLQQQTKLLSEFTKKIDPDLPFFYWTGHEHRYTSELLASFNVPSGKEEKLDRVNVSRRCVCGEPRIIATKALINCQSIFSPCCRETTTDKYNDR